MSRVTTDSTVPVVYDPVEPVPSDPAEIARLRRELGLARTCNHAKVLVNAADLAGVLAAADFDRVHRIRGGVR